MGKDYKEQKLLESLREEQEAQLHGRRYATRPEGYYPAEV